MHQSDDAGTTETPTLTPSTTCERLGNVAAFIFWAVVLIGGGSLIINALPEDNMETVPGIDEGYNYGPVDEPYIEKNDRICEDLKTCTSDGDF